MRKSILIALFGIILAMQIFFVSAGCVVPYDGMVITKNIVLCPGNYYLPNGIEVYTSYTELDCNGAVLNGGGSVSSKGINLALNIQKNVIKNCVVRNYYYGIKTWNGAYQSFLNNEVSENTYGFYFDNSDYETVKNNKVHDNSQVGIYFFWASRGNVIESNIVENNNIAGIELDWDVQLSTVSNNIVKGGNYGIYSGCSYGDHPAYKNNYIGNYIEGTKYGFTTCRSYGNLFQYNTVKNNDYGFYISSNNDVIINNNIINNKFSASSDYFKGVNIWSRNKEGNYWSDYDSSSEGCIDSNKNGICDSAYVIDSGNKDNSPFNKPNGWFRVEKQDDLVLFKPSTGEWYIAELNKGGLGNALAIGVLWGDSSMTPVPGDYDNDGKDDLALFKKDTGKWYIAKLKSDRTLGAALAFCVKWGDSSMTPVPGDYDGDGKYDLALFKPSTGEWYIAKLKSDRTLGAALAFGVKWGDSSMTPVSGDYDGDGKSDLALFKPSTGEWFIAKLSEGKLGSALAMGVSWGDSSMNAVSGDYDGDGKYDLALFQSSSGKWYIAKLTNGKLGSAIAMGVSWGDSSMTPVSGNFDGDNKNDLALFQASTGKWYIARIDSYNLLGGPIALDVLWGDSSMTPVSGDYGSA
jgi:parallel beta-helix repeat protein